MLILFARTLTMMTRCTLALYFIVAVDRAEAKRRELQHAQPAARQSARDLSMLPKAAALYRQQIAQGLGGDHRAVLKARHILRDLIGPVTLTPKGKGELWTDYKLTPGALIKGGGYFGSGGALLHLPTYLASAPVQ